MAYQADFRPPPPRKCLGGCRWCQTDSWFWWGGVYGCYRCHWCEE